MKKIKKIFFSINLIPFLITFSGVILQSFHQLSYPKVGTDFASFVLSATAPLLKIGMPYTDFWGINPPGLLILLGGWGLAFGTTLQSWHILYLISSFIIATFSWLILKKIFSPFESLMLFGVWAIFFFSSSVQTQFMPSEISGLTFLMIGVYLALRNRISLKQTFWACFIFIFAGQIKEVFALTGIMMLPHLLVSLNKGKKNTIRFLSSAVAGIIIALSIIIIYLLMTRTLNEYQKILTFKSNRFSITDMEAVATRQYRAIQYPRDRFFQFNYQIPAIFIVGLISLLFFLSTESKIKTQQVNHKNILNLSIQFSEKYFIYLICFFFYLGAVYGYAMQNGYGNKYDLAIIFPTIIILAIISKIIAKTLISFFTIEDRHRELIILILGLLLMGLFLFPKKIFLLEQLKNIQHYSLSNHYHFFINLENPAFLRLENKIKNNITPDECITKVYGWGVADAYYYSHRKSCSKHFLINIIPPQQFDNYVTDLLENPPSALIYTRAGSDLDVPYFEAMTFDFSAVIKNCYHQDDEFETLYWPKEKGSWLKECIKVGNKISL